MKKTIKELEYEIKEIELQLLKGYIDGWRRNCYMMAIFIIILIIMLGVSG